jgi:hypothetical protein
VRSASTLVDGVNFSLDGVNFSLDGDPVIPHSTPQSP